MQQPKFKSFLLFLLLLPTLLFGQVYPGEYDCWIKDPATGKICDIVTAGSTLSKVFPVSGSPVIAPGAGKASASLHTFGMIGVDSFAYVYGENACNISGLGLTAANLPITKTGVPNARQIIAYANSGDGSSQGLGYGFAIVTNSDALILLGNTQSGFRGDGTEGNKAEPGPYVVTSVGKAIKKVAAGSFIYALCSDGTVQSWGGTRRQYYPTYVLGRGVDNPDPTRPGQMKFPEAIVDLIGGGDWTYFKGASGAIYGVAYNTRYLGLGPNVGGQNTPFNLTKILGLPGIPAQLAVGTQASYALLPNGDLYAWGDNTQAAIGNGQEANMASYNYGAPWGGGVLWVDKPVKVNPAGVSFVKVYAAIGDAFYVYAEDTNGNLWVWGRNKGYVLWNGIGGSSSQQSAQPNLWDVLSPTRITGFGDVSSVPTNPMPPVTPACPACPTCPPVVVCPPPVVCPAPRTVTQVIVHINGVAYTIPASWLTITYSDGSSQ